MSRRLLDGATVLVNGVHEILWDEGLTGASRDIAAGNFPFMRVAAGPGTGKTFSLMHRVARVLQEGTLPGRILVCTFTRTAAHDLERALSLLRVRGARRVKSGTLHSFCFSILQRAEVLTALGRIPRPLLDFEARFLAEDLKSARFGSVREVKKRIEAFTAAWARLQTDEPGWPRNATDRAFGIELERWLRFHRGMLIGELVPLTLNYLRENPLSPVLNHFEHVMVDEYQDLNKAEQVLLDQLAGDGQLIVIGDEDQSIYTFKHAYPEGITTFHDTHPGTHDEQLDECRRCAHRIVGIANSLISYNTHRARRNLRFCPDREEGRVTVVQWLTQEDEAAGIARILRNRMVEGNVQVGEILVLAPNRHFGYAIRDALAALAVPAHSFFREEALAGNPKADASNMGQQAFTLLTLLVNPSDRVALRCWCGFGSSSLSKSAWTRLRDYAEAVGLEPNEALQRISLNEIQLPYSVPIVRRFQELQAQLPGYAGLVGNQLLDALFPAGPEWTEPFRAIALNIEDDEYDAATLRDTLIANITQPEMPTDVDYVRVMSLHKSKGLTADLVVVVGCIDGCIPYYDKDRPILDRAAMEEQRRLFYVAMTRARNELIVSNFIGIQTALAQRIRIPVRRSARAGVAETIPSRFIRELGPSCPATILGTEAR